MSRAPEYILGEIFSLLLLLLNERKKKKENLYFKFFFFFMFHVWAEHCNGAQGKRRGTMGGGKGHRLCPSTRSTSFLYNKLPSI